MATDKLISVEHYKKTLWNFREKLIECGKKEAYDCVSTLIKGLKIEPAVDAVEVVRCKDCCWCKEYHCNYMCQHPTDGMPGDVYADDFCSYGERKE